MPLAPGLRIGAYEILSLIGSGGMGEVYRARDTKLDRLVAIKILPEAVAHDAERLARFDREAKTLASLNHPHIAIVYGFEETKDVRAIVMELVDGPTLADRIVRGPIPIDEALPIARQIADALEAAHEQGIIHRDLKPANIKLRSDGSAKVLDFGLARAVANDGPLPNRTLSNSPTITSPAAMTGIGVLLGTAAYMSPEQAKGKVADKRSDVWAFGCVFYEMLTGKQAFAGEDVSETLAAVLRAEPDWTALPVATPAAVRRMLSRCLTKDPRERLRDVADAALDLRDARSETTAAIEPVSVSRRRLTWAVVGVLGLVCVSLTGLVWAMTRRTSGDGPAYRSVMMPLQIDGGKELPIANVRRGLALSPDGRRLAFVSVGSDGRPILWIQPLDAAAAQPLRGTEAATTAISPTWSPDGRRLVFFADRTLTRIDAAGGPPVVLHEGVARMFSTAAWNRDDVILFAGSDGGALRILRIAAGGGPAPAATSVGEGEASHSEPFFLPDGNHFLFRVNGTPDTEGIYVGSLDSTARDRVIAGRVAFPAYANGFLLFVRETTLMAQPFDARRLVLSGEAMPLAPAIRVGGAPSSGGSFAVSDNGVLVYQEDTAETSQLVWVDRSGRELGVLGERGELGYIQIGPNDDRVAVSITDPDGYRDVWLYDATRGNPTRFTSDPRDEFSAAWSPDGETLVFASGQEGGGLGLYEKATTASGNGTTVAQIAGNEIPTSWSADGRFLLYQTAAPTADLWVLPLVGDRKPIPFIVKTRFNEAYGQFSPDGRWIAYSSNETGRTEVYVAPFQRAGETTRISSSGGAYPRWRRDGKELYFVAADTSLTTGENTLMAVEVRESASRLAISDPRPLFNSEFRNANFPYAVTGDGQRFLINRSVGRAQMPISLIVNWPALLNK